MVPILQPFVLSPVILAGILTSVAAQSANEMDQRREVMVQRYIVGMGIKNERVIQSMGSTRRDQFIPLRYRRQAYWDQGLPIGHQQTISSPFIVAFMTEQLDPQPDDRVLEIGTGSGYQAAILSPLVKDVYTIEIVAPLGRTAEKTLRRLKYKNVHTRIGDGFQGWPEHAPFDKIVVTCSPEKIPRPLVDQLAEGGRIVIPVGQRYQQSMFLGEKRDGRIVVRSLRPTYFVPMTGDAERLRKVKPDAAHPSIANGGFEDVSDENDMPVAWFYQRQMKSEETDDAHEGDRCAKFVNEIAGRPSIAMQGFPVDGRVVRELDVRLMIKTKAIAPGNRPDEIAALVVTYFDKNRFTLGTRKLGPWRGTRDWESQSDRIRVPAKARHASLQVGLFGATGTLWVDAIQVESSNRK